MKRKKFNKYEPVIDAILDLHGYFISEAEPLVLEFLADAELKGFKRVMIITGKGLNSPGGFSVLKEMVEEILKTKKYNYQEAKISQGGSGAIVVKLR